MKKNKIGNRITNRKRDCSKIFIRFCAVPPRRLFLDWWHTSFAHQDSCQSLSTLRQLNSDIEISKYRWRNVDRKDVRKNIYERSSRRYCTEPNENSRIISFSNSISIFIFFSISITISISLSIIILFLCLFLLSIPLSISLSISTTTSVLFFSFLD